MRALVLLAVIAAFAIPALGARRPVLEPLQPQLQPKAELAVLSEEAAIPQFMELSAEEQEYQGGTEYQSDVPDASDTGSAAPSDGDKDADALVVEFTFSLDYNTLTANPDDLANFKAQLAEDVASALGLEASRVRVTAVAPGSVKATLEIQEGGGKSLEDLAVYTRALYEDEASALFRGVVTSNIDNSIPLKFIRGPAPEESAAAVSRPAAALTMAAAAGLVALLAL